MAFLVSPIPPKSSRAERPSIVRLSLFPLASFLRDERLAKINRRSPPTVIPLPTYSLTCYLSEFIHPLFTELNSRRRTLGASLSVSNLVRKRMVK